MKRSFTLGSAADGKLVVLEVDGPRLRMVQQMPDGTTKKTEKVLASESAARAQCERMAGELISRGYRERGAAKAKSASGAAKAKSASGAAKARPASREPEADAMDGAYALEGLEETAAEAEPVLPRLAPAPASSAGPAPSDAPAKKKTGKGKGKKKKKKAGSDDSLDPRVIGGVVAVGVAFVALLGYLAYDAFLKPPTIIGTWRGSMVEYEIGRPMIYTQYDLILDATKNAALTIQEESTEVGTYAVKGNLLTLSLKDEEGDVSQREYKIKLGRATLDLFDPSSGKQVVQLIRFREEPKVAKAPPKTPEAPADLAAEAAGQADEAADRRLASVEFSPKDGAFKLRHPPGWEADTGSRPDNTYSWATFTKGSAKIQVFADVQGSLMSGSDSAGQHEEGSELAPVHRAHELYAKPAAEMYSDYKESRPTLFKGAQLGEGRIATFAASSGGLFGSKLRGYRVTLLTNDRRISILCQAPEKEFAKLKPTFLAVARSLSR